MNSDIRLSVGWNRHPKIIKLKRRLGADGQLGLVTLWTWAGEQRLDGILSRMDEEDIAIAAGYSENPKNFVDTLVSLHLLDRSDDGVLSIHDWADHQPDALRRHRYKQFAGYDENGNRLFPENWQAIKAAIYHRDGRECQYCGTTEGPFHIDHVIPRIKGGADDPKNLVVSCAFCNLSKGSKSVAEWMGL